MGNEVAAAWADKIIFGNVTCWVLNVGEPIPELDGETRRFRYGMLTEALLRQGHSIVRWSSTFRHVSKTFRARETKKVRVDVQLSAFLLHGPGYRLHRSPRRLYHHLCEAGGFRMAARKEPLPDIIICSVPTLALAQAAGDYASSFGIPLVLDVSDCWPEHYLSVVPRHLRFAFRPFLSHQFRVLRKAVRRSAALTAVSQTYLRWAATGVRVPDSTLDKVFPLGYAAPEQGKNSSFPKILADLGIGESDFLILFAGTFHSSHDFKTVVNCARRLDETGDTRIKFLFIGSGPQERVLRSAAIKLRNVFLLDWISDQETLWQLLNHATVGLCPYHAGCSMSLPNKPFEFMAAGKPLLSSLEGELWDLITSEKVGLNYCSSSSQSLLKAIEQFRNNDAQLLAAGSRARELWKQRYDAPRIYREFAEHIESVGQRFSMKNCATIPVSSS